MRKFFFVLFLNGLVVASCQSPNSNTPTLSEADLAKKKDLVKSVMAIHDEAMPWLDEIHQLKKTISAQKDSLTPDSLAEIIDNHCQALDSADEAMMNWMRNYREPSNELPMDSIENYLNQQQAKATNMRDFMREAMNNSHQFIAQ